jgi:hypothetical protein
VKHKIQCALFASLLAVNRGVLRAQASDTSRAAAKVSAPPAPQEKPPAKKHRLGPPDTSGNRRIPGEGWDWFGAGKGGRNYGFGHSLLRVALSRPSNGQQSLATAAHAIADVEITRNFGVNAYYARVWGKSVISKIYPSERDVQLAYVETHLRF